ncbi:MAG: hypothetical protein KJZ53_08725 [Anaerolineales bacterium]|nr:hypothetical protein [Anaerolineales bacterium]
MSKYWQQSLFSLQEVQTNKRKERRGSFVDNMRLPIHRWFRFSAGFSGEWVSSVVFKKKQANPELVVLDPFAGSGTTLVESNFAGVKSIGIEAHPYIHRIAKAKLSFQTVPLGFKEMVSRILTEAARPSNTLNYEYPELISRVYGDESLLRLDSLRRATELYAEDSEISELAWLALTSILRLCASAGTAQWQYILPGKSKKAPLEPFFAYEKQTEMMYQDIENASLDRVEQLSTLHRADARDLGFLSEGSMDLTITSPPYANNYDYADAVRLEMSFWGDVNSWGDLHKVARKYLIVSSSQHASAEKLVLEELLSDPSVAPIRDEIARVCYILEAERKNHGGKKNYHTMIAGYFSDMSKVLKELFRVTTSDGELYIVIGDSAPYGVYVPVDRWFSELALAHGFNGSKFEKLRERNVKWDNRVHKVPLKEGILNLSKKSYG